MRQSIKDFDSFESITLASELEHHDLLDCRRISALLYRKNKRYEKSIEVSEKDQLFKDAMETVSESKDPALAERLMRTIVEMKDKELFAAMLYTCYELIKPDVVMELGWRMNMMEFVMPYFIQFMSDMSKRVETVQKSTDDIKKKEEKHQKEKLDQPLEMGMGMQAEMMFGAMGGPQVAAIMPAPGGMMGGGMNMGGMPPMGGGAPPMGSGMPPMGGMGGGMPPMGGQQPFGSNPF